jgi:hypothetical protein
MIKIFFVSKYEKAGAFRKKWEELIDSDVSGSMQRAISPRSKIQNYDIGFRFVSESYFCFPPPTTNPSLQTKLLPAIFVRL